MKKKFLVGFGACYIDLILEVPHFPGEDDKVRAKSIVRRRGGNCPNTFEVLQQLLHPPDPAASPARLSDHGVDSEEFGLKDDDEISLVLCSMLPARESTATQFVRASLGPSVDISHSAFREESTEAASSYIIRNVQTGSRTIVNYNELAEMTVPEMTSIVDELGELALWYHFEGRIPESALPAIVYIRKHYPQARVSVEVEKPGRDGLREMAALADVVFYSKSWARASGYQTAQDCVRGEAAAQATVAEADRDDSRLLCCTWGEEGAVAYRPKLDRFESAAAHKPHGRPVQDTIGAGDTFIAGMLYSLIYRAQSWSLLEKLEFANELAGRKVVQEGFGGLGRQT